MATLVTVGLGLVLLDCCIGFSWLLVGAGVVVVVGFGGVTVGVGCWLNLAINLCIRLVVGCWSIVGPVLLSWLKFVVVFIGTVVDGPNFQLGIFLLFVVLVSSVVVVSSFLVLSMLSLRTGFSFAWVAVIISVSCSCLLFL